MKIVFIGASSLAIATAELLLQVDDEVVLVTTTDEYEQLHEKWSNGKAM